MGELEELEALKRAYAEMILNTTKEAAARVMASDIRARNFELDLISVKEDATRMLLRLKQMIDAKTTKAEITSSAQQRKIEELESQLNEAEEVILDLRTQLNQAHEELVEAKNKNVHLLRTLDVKSPDLDVSTLEHRFCGSVKQNAKWNSGSEVCSVDNALLTSIIITSKEPELYRNGFTQRTCAVETILVDKQLPPGDDSHSFSNGEATEQEMELKTHSSKIEKLGMVQNFRNGVRYSIKSCKMRRKTNQTGKAKVKSCKQRCHWYLKPRQKHSSISHRRSYSHGSKSFGHAFTNNENINTIENSPGLEEKVNLDQKHVVSVVRRSLRKRKPKYRDDAITPCWSSNSHRFKKRCQPLSALACLKSNKVEFSLKCGHNQLKTEDKSKTEELDHEYFPNCESSYPENLPENDMQLMDVLVKLDEQAAEIELNSFSQINCDLTGAKVSAIDNYDQANSKRHFEYTFSRRKMESLSNLEKKFSFGESSLERRSQERESRPSRMQNFTLTNKSSRNSRRVLQVARQLISLSAKHQ